MDKEKQIEDIVIKVKTAIGNNGTYRSFFDYIEMDSNDVDHTAEEVAEILYAAGYRKQSDVITEFVKKLEKKWFWLPTNSREWAAVVKISDIYDIAAECGAEVVE